MTAGAIVVPDRAPVRSGEWLLPGEEAPPVPVLLGFQELLAKRFEAPLWRVEGLLPTVGAGLILGAEKSGKSLLGLQLSLCVAAGLPFLDRAVRQCPTLYVEEEGPEIAHKDRLRRQAERLGLLEKEVPIHLALRQRIRLDVDETTQWLHDAVLEHDANLVVIGPLSQVAAIDDENKAGEVNRLMRRVNELATELGILVVLTHHRRKDKEAGGKPSIREFFATARGSSALVAAIDVGLGIAREQEDGHGWLYVLQRDGPGFRQHFDLDPDSLLVTSTKPPERKLKADVADVLQVIRESGPITIGSVAARFDVAYGTAKARVDGLVAKGDVCAVDGKGERRFVVTTTAFKWLAPEDPAAEPVMEAAQPPAYEADGGTDQGTIQVGSTISTTSPL